MCNYNRFSLWQSGEKNYVLKKKLSKGDLVQGLSKAVWDRQSPDDSKGHHMDYQAERGERKIRSIQTIWP